ncbi:NUDIX hydrolase [Azospirillum brasilense]|uniref:NUDIX hydrolase n=1 Tax=Azospirillum brasilense TaxID=192 RepID=A0A6L3ASG7_AZOBR|nr:NUDIX hydrolase [Azospirillum brasilense]KAA0677903.1 NUDIX hydrolase [Azospirillum brasilense]
MPVDDEQPPFVRRSRRIGFRNTVWLGCFDNIVGNNGTQVEDYLLLVPHGDHLDMLTGVSVLPVVDGRVLLMRVYRLGTERWNWEIPRGFVDPGEAPDVAARRELTEETGLSCSDGGLVPLGFYTPENSTIRARGALFAAVDCRHVQERDMSEMGLGQIEWFALDEALALADRSGIEDASTALALYRYARHLSHG